MTTTERPRPPRARARRRRPRRRASRSRRAVAPWFGIAKVGLRALRRGRARGLRCACTTLGFRVFADLKLHDIPTTVERAARVLGRHGVDFLNFHAAGGVDDAARRRRRAARRRARRGHRTPRSRSRSPCSRATRTSTRSTTRLQVARDAGCDGVVCSGADVARRAARAGCARWCPASGSRAATRTIRRASTRPATRSRAAPTGS